MEGGKNKIREISARLKIHIRRTFANRDERFAIGSHARLKTIDPSRLNRRARLLPRDYRSCTTDVGCGRVVGSARK